MSFVYSFEVAPTFIIVTFSKVKYRSVRSSKAVVAAIILAQRLLESPERGKQQ